ncbi:LysR substrate-binding domain-containing protein [Variovorax sp. J22R24]|uniref:LysR family transcriptional regulator n=1 Tax=Variovorax gracilis TaxID=3053502 RepID=UPI00257793E6|nr:LysR family transcriptional regulator [Variovorax sp. J22R24]MDM0109247.1 LysR substrate-binding domain-containing protein [Variovorax sp. J22R24]
MPTTDLSTRQLRAFAALADQCNFTRAAQRCHLSQPAFSTLIRTLEETVGARLFDRDTRSVQLTPEGRQFESSARRLLDDMQELIGDLADRVERRKGRVSVAALPSLAAGWLPQILAEFMRTWPGIAVELHDALSDACIARVRNHEADFALSASEARSTSAVDLRSTKLCSDRFHLVCRTDHPLAKMDRLSPKHLAPYPFIQMTRNSSVRQALDAALHPLQLNTAFEVEHLATVTGLVEAGVGISVVPTLTLFHFQRATLLTRPLSARGLSRTIHLVQRREGSLSVAAQTLHDLIFERMGSLKVEDMVAH